MPGLNGIAAAARLKESGSTAKVVFVTNLHDREFVQESLALGDVGFVVKDRLVADLLPAIRTRPGRSDPSSRRRSRSDLELTLVTSGSAKRSFSTQSCHVLPVGPPARRSPRIAENGGFRRTKPRTDTEHEDCGR